MSDIAIALLLLPASIFGLVWGLLQLLRKRKPRAKRTSKDWHGKVIDVLDGDTIVVSGEKGKVRVRLAGIDCPETDQPYGKKAKAFTNKRISGEKVLVIPKEKDTYGRLVADVYLEEERGAYMVSRGLLIAGYAWQDPVEHGIAKHGLNDSRPMSRRDMKRLEEKARRSQKGLWQQASPTPPWKWREQNG